MTDPIIGAGGIGNALSKGVSSFVKDKITNKPQDNLESKAYIRILDLLCEGEIQGFKDGEKSIFFNDTPIQNADGSRNFDDYYWEARSGTQNQTYIPGFNEILNEVPVNVVVTNASAVTRTINGSNASVSVGSGQRSGVDAIRVSLTFPRLQRIRDNGEINGTSVTIRIETQYSGGNWTTRVEDTVSGRTDDVYQRDYRVALDGTFPVNVRVSRVTADTTDEKITDTFSWFSYTEITYAKLRYPNSALVALRLDSEQFSDVPSRSYLIRGLKIRIPSNASVHQGTGALLYNSSINGGVWDGTFNATTVSGVAHGGTQWAADPAWCLWDLLCSSRYGFGQFINPDNQNTPSTLDKFAFYAASQYCSALNTRPGGTTNDYHATTGRHGVPDGFGGYEPRFSCNVNIQTTEDAYKVINDMCSVFRAMPYWAAGSLTFSQDRPSNPTYVFTQANVTEEGFTYNGSSQKTRATVAIVKYFDNTIRDFAYEVVEDQKNISKYGVVTKEIDAFACTSRGQARRMAEWLLYAELYESEIVSFTASIEAGVIVRPGQIISIQDQLRLATPSPRYAGRIRSATSTTVTIDQEKSKNLILSSEDFSTIWTLQAVTTTTNTIQSPFDASDTTTADAIYETATNAEHYARQTVLGLEANTIYTVSAYIKNLSGRNVTVRILNQNLSASPLYGAFCVFNPTTGATVGGGVAAINATPAALSATATITPAGNGWYRVTVSANLGSNCTGYIVDLFSTSNQTTTFLGSTSQGFYAWGVQLEKGALATDYIPTTTDLASAVGTSPKLTVLLPNGTLEQRNITSISGEVITVSSAFSAVPNPNSIWLFENASTIPFTSWRVLTVQEQEESRYAITALTYNSSKYDYIERGASLQFRTLTDLNPFPDTPTDFIATESLYTYLDEVRSKIQVGWSPIQRVSIYEVQWRKDQGNWNIERVRGPLHELLNITPGFFEYRIYALSYSELPSRTFLYGSITAIGKDLPPANVTNFTAENDPSIGITLKWNSIPDLDIQGYEVWQGSTFGAGIKLGLFQTTSVKVGDIPIGTTTWWIKALDNSGNYSVSATSVSFTVTIAPAPVVQGSFIGPDVELRWEPVVGTLATSRYEIRYGNTSSTWATAIQAGTVQGTVFRMRAMWVSTLRFYVAALDINGTAGTPGTRDLTVVAPKQPTITEEVIDNNVLLKWNDSTATLPIEKYEIRRGPTFEPGLVRYGAKQGLFTSIFETSSGTYTYWVAGVDSAGNIGTPGSRTAVVNQPPDYQLTDNYNSTFSGTRTNCYTEDGALVACVNTTETWAAHFTSRGWNTIQDQITAGFPIYAMPSATTGVYEEVRDLTTTIAGVKITATRTEQVVAGAVTVTPTISVSNTSGTGPWTNYAGVDSVYATQFRWVKIRYDFASAGGDDILRISALNLRLDSKLRNDFGTGTANAADTTGTVVNFNIQFIDVQAISVTPATTQAYLAVYDFQDVPNPTSFRVYMFDAAGTRVSGNFSWSARGV